MDVNGKLFIKGKVNDPVLSAVAASTVAGRLETEYQGVIKFGNGIKIQWDIATVVGDSTTAFTLPEAFTEANYSVMGTWNATSGDSEAESTLQIYIPTTNNLSEVWCTSADDNDKAVRYVVIGKDTV